MKDNLYLKRGLITQSLSPVFFLLIIRHFHFDYVWLISRFLDELKFSPCNAMRHAFCHPRFGELLLFVLGIVWMVLTVIGISAFKNTQIAGFESHGETVIAVDEKKDAAASFLMTFILPLLIDDLATPQNWISYLLVIVVVYAVLYQSNLYYQSPVLSILRYKVFTFKVVNPYEEKGMRGDIEYIGITRNIIVTDKAAIMWKHISDNVFLVYNEK